MPKTLFAISDDFQALDALLEELDGDISNPDVAAAVDAWFAELDRDLSNKADNYAAFVQELNARSKARKEEAERLSKRAAMDDNTAKWLKDRLKCVLQERGVKKLDTTRYTISVCNNGGKLPVIIPDENLLPDAFCRFVRIPNTDVIRDTLINGQVVHGAILGERGTHLRIG